MRFIEQIKKALEYQGRSKKWLASRLEISYKTLYVKMNNDSFSISEKHYISLILDLKGDE